ncbi:MAG: acyltransferase family protein [Mariniphaga sp.]|nr:acyltransferase family protein [Mariniphaga sp.]
MKTNSPSRLYYIDNIRIFLIGLVVLHHFGITYGAPGGWYYNESQAGIPEMIPQAMFNATNQAFFMGMFFFISAFFTAASIKRKSTGKFLKDRLVRLGIPLLAFYFLLNPLSIYIRNHFIRGDEVSLIKLITNFNECGFGPMWFVEALLFFTIIYLFIRTLKIKIVMKFPKTWQIISIALLVAFIQFTIRIWLPVGWSMPFTNFQFPFFVQYIFLLFFGVVAYQNNWLESITFKMGKQWFIFTQLLIFIGFPVVFIGGGAIDKGLDSFMGGFTFQNLMYAVWEQLLGFSLIIGLFGLFKKWFNCQGKFAQKLSDSAYGVYLFHTPVIIGISAIFMNFNIPQLLKFIVLSPVALLACFFVAWLVKQIPGVKKVL